MTIIEEPHHSLIFVERPLPYEDAKGDNQIRHLRNLFGDALSMLPTDPNLREMILMPKIKGESVPAKLRPIYEELTALTDAICREYLDDEYAMLARKMAAALARKRPSPLERGSADVWASGIVYTIGQINFLFDKSQVPHLRADELASLFGVGQKTAANKACQIRDVLKISPLDVNWWRPSKIDNNPMAWIVLVNGLIVDARDLPYEIQEELARRRVIPTSPKKRGSSRE